MKLWGEGICGGGREYKRVNGDGRINKEISVQQD